MLFQSSVVFGAGIAGLWAFNRLKGAGYNALLLESNRIGCGQTIASQGILHSGLKYAIAGKVNKLAKSISALPQGSIRVDKETIVRGVGRTFQERTFIESEGILSMFLREDKHTEGAGAFVQKRKPDWKDGGL